MRTAPHTEVRAGRVEEYASWTIRRSGRGLFHLTEGEDYARLLAAREQLPVDVARQAGTVRLLDVAHDCSRDGAEAGRPVAWGV